MQRVEIPLNPPAEWFTPPADMPKDAGCIVEPNGRLCGYLAHWGAVLMDGTSERWTPPRSKNAYSYAHTGDTVTADGTIIKTANLGGDFGHAPQGGTDLADTQRFYENTQTQLARVRYGEDEHGVWFAGACWPNVSELDMAKLRASARSGHWCAVGDWRDVQSGRIGYELVGACLVNVPGLKYARADKAASGVLSLRPLFTTPQEQASMTNVRKFERVAASGTLAILATDGEAAAAGVPVGGVLVIEGVPTSDGRFIEANATTWRVVPLPLYASLENLPGHDSAALVGRIDAIERSEGGEIHYSGVVFPDAGDGAGQATLDAIQNGMLTGVSIDGAVGMDDVYYNEDDIAVMTAIEIIGATLTPMPAFAGATVTLLSADTRNAQGELAMAATDTGDTTTADQTTEDEVQQDIADDNAEADALSALRDQVSALADRLEVAIGLLESAQMSARYEAATRKISA